MHLSMLSPRVGGGAHPGDFDIFMEARVKFPPLYPGGFCSVSDMS